MQRLILLLFLFTPFTAKADQLDEQIAALRFNSPVLDQAGMLSQSQMNSLASSLYKIHQDTGIQMAVVTLPSLFGHPIESVSIQITDRWKLGNKTTDKGVLILVAKEERRVRIEVGQGLEGEITDAYSKRIIDQIFVPNFRSGQFYEGIATGIVQLMQYADPSYQVNFGSNYRTVKRKTQRNMSWLEILISMALMFFLLFTRLGRTILLVLLASGRGGGGGFGGSGGGGYGGGGGGFSGGGSSGSW